jgi:hypothetical protein
MVFTAEPVHLLLALSEQQAARNTYMRIFR